MQNAKEQRGSMALFLVRIHTYSMAPSKILIWQARLEEFMPQMDASWKRDSQLDNEV
jgi:hypothetical protein